MSAQDKQSKQEREEREDEDERTSDAPEEEGDEAKSSSDAEESEASEEGSETESDEAAARVAAALGVREEGGEEAEAEGEEAQAEGEEEQKEAAKPNRAARRREEALARRKKRAGQGGSDDDALPADKNARAKELLKRRREQAAAAEKQRPVASALDAGEMVDDALARSASAVTKWLRTNAQMIQGAILIGLIGVGGYMFYTSRLEKKAGEASGMLAQAVAAERGVVMEEDKRTDEQKEANPMRVFKTDEERAQATIGAFGKVIEEHGGTGAALLAKLGQAGAYLEKKEYDKALEAYSAVLGSPLAAADPDVKGRATEGVGFAKEGKGELDAALTSFKQLASIDVKGYKELATYHEARILLAKGEKDKAKEVLKPLDEKLQLPSQEPQPTEYLKDLVHNLLTQIDPSTPATAPQFGGGGMPTPQMLQDMARRAQENAQKKALEQPAGGKP